MKDLYIKIANEVFGKTKFGDERFHFCIWQIVDRNITTLKEIKKQTEFRFWQVGDEEIKDKLKELHVKYDGESRERLLDTLWKYCRKNIAGPAFLVNPPLLVAPLAKPNPDGKTAQMFQPILAGSEIGRGYSELNNPIYKRKF